jgi:hypothetical protein
MTQVSSGGEVIVLDSGGFAPFTITKSVSIIAPDGVFAGITVVGDGTGFNEVGIIVQGGSGNRVRLRGLTLRGTGPGTTGIAGGSAILFVDDCLIEGFSEAGMSVSVSRVYVENTVIRNCGKDAINLLDFNIATIEGSTFEANGGSGVLAGASKAVIRDSVSSGNANGFMLFGSGEMNVEGCLAANNSAAGIGVVGFQINGALPILRVSNSTATNNGIGLSQDDSAGPTILLSRGDNTVEGNSLADLQGVIGAYSPK